MDDVLIIVNPPWKWPPGICVGVSCVPLANNGKTFGGTPFRNQPLPNIDIRPKTTSQRNKEVEGLSFLMGIFVDIQFNNVMPTSKSSK